MPMLELIDMRGDGTNADAAELARLQRLLSKGPPTVASTGGPTPVMIPGAMPEATMAQPPAGAVPQMGMGETPPPLPQPSIPMGLMSGGPLPPQAQPDAPVTAGMLSPVPMTPGGARPLQPPPGAPAAPAVTPGMLSPEMMTPGGAQPFAPPVMAAEPPGIGPGMPQPAPAPSAPPVDAADTSLIGRLKSAGSGIGDWINDHRMTLAALGAGMAGAQSIGQGLNRGGTMALPAMQADIALQRQNQTAAWLMQKNPNLTRDQALVMATNPDIMKQLIPSLVGAKQLVPAVIGTDVLGHPIHGSFDPVRGRYYDISGREVGASTGSPVPGATIGDPAKWAAMTPDERLATLDPQVQNEIKAIYEGRQAATGRTVQTLLPLVNSVYPDFTMQDYKIKADTQKSFTGQGKNALELKAANTAITHADNLARKGGLIDQLPNIKFIPEYANPVIHGVKSNLGDEKFQELKGKYEAQVEGLAGELSKAFNGGQTAEADRQRWRDVLSSAKSPAELHAAINQAMEMLHGRLSATAESYNKGMQTMRDPLTFLDPANQQIFKRLRGIDQNAPESPAGAPSAPPAPGQPAAAQNAPSAPAAASARPADKAGYDALPAGAPYVAPDGTTRAKGKQSNLESPPYPGARLAPNGKHYVPDPSRPGKYFEVTYPTMAA